MKKILSFFSLSLLLFANSVIIELESDYEIKSSNLQKQIKAKAPKGELKGSLKITHIPTGKKQVQIYWNMYKGNMLKTPLTTKLNLQPNENIIPRSVQFRAFGDIAQLEAADKQQNKTKALSNASKTSTKSNQNAKASKQNSSSRSPYGPQVTRTPSAANQIQPYTPSSNANLNCSPTIDKQAQTIQNKAILNGACVNDGAPISFRSDKFEVCEKTIDKERNTVQLKKLINGKCENSGTPIVIETTYQGCSQTIDYAKNLVYPTSRQKINYNGSDITITDCTANFDNPIRLERTFAGCKSVFRKNINSLVQQERFFYNINGQIIDVSTCKDSDSIIPIKPVREYNEICKPIIDYENETVRNAYRQIIYVGADTSPIEISPCRFEEPKKLQKDYVEESSKCKTRIDIINQIATPRLKYYDIVDGKTQHFGDCKDDTSIKYLIQSTPMGCNTHQSGDKIVYERRLYYTDNNGLEHSVTPCTPYKVNEISVYRGWAGWALRSDLSLAYLRYRDFYIDPISKEIIYLQSDVREEKGKIKTQNSVIKNSNEQDLAVEFDVHIDYCKGENAFGEINDDKKFQLVKAQRFINDTGKVYELHSRPGIYYYGKKRFNPQDIELSRVEKTLDNPFQKKYFETCDNSNLNYRSPYIYMGKEVVKEEYAKLNKKKNATIDIFTTLIKQGDKFYVEGDLKKELNTSNGIVPTSRFIKTMHDNNRGLGEFKEKILQVTSKDKYKRPDGSIYYENEQVSFEIQEFIPSFTPINQNEYFVQSLGWKTLELKNGEFVFDTDKKVLGEVWDRRVKKWAYPPTVERKKYSSFQMIVSRSYPPYTLYDHGWNEPNSFMVNLGTNYKGIIDFFNKQTGYQESLPQYAEVIEHFKKENIYLRYDKTLAVFKTDVYKVRSGW